MTRSFFILFSIFYFLISETVAAVPDKLKQSIDIKLQELQKISAEIEKTETELKRNQTQQRSLKQEVKNLDYTISRLNLNIQSASINIEKLSLELEALRYDIQDTKAGITLKKETIVRLLRELHEKEQQPLLALILSNKSLAEGFLEMQIIEDLNFSLSGAVKTLSVLKQNLDLKFQDRNAKKNNLEREHSNLRNQKGIVSDKKTERSQLLAQTKNQEKSYQQELESLEKKQAAISDEIEKIEDELRRYFDPTLLPAKRPGVLAMPIANPRITQNFGEVSWLYRGKSHNGTDFGAPIGTEIFAAADGLIFATGDNGKYQYGRHILIQHNNNLATLYAHLSKVIVKKGEQVARGKLIGYSGNTGYAIGRGHLHFGLYWGPSVLLKSFSNCPCGLVPVGVTINPLDYL